MRTFDTQSEPPERAAANGAASRPEPGWPTLDPDLAAVQELLERHRPAAPPADAGFAAALGERLLAAAATAAVPAKTVRRARRPALEEMMDAWRVRPRAAAAAALAVAFSVAGLAWAWTAVVPTAPEAITRTELVARNARAWSEPRGLTGAFATGDGWYFEEWISRQPDDTLRFKRFVQPAERTTSRAQWNISDGRTEWVVDAVTRQVSFTRPAVAGDFTAVAPNDAMQCTSLALPTGIGDGPDPWPMLMGRRPVYRMEGLLRDGSPAVYWVDARDSLVLRIDRPGLGTIWERLELRVDPRLPAELFDPSSLANL